MSLKFNVMLISFFALTCSSSPREKLPENFSTGDGGVSTTTATNDSSNISCTDGEKRSCHVILSPKDNVTSGCFVGVQTCAGGEWSKCVDEN